MTLANNSVVSPADVAAVMADDGAKVRFVRALDYTKAQRYEEAQEALRLAANRGAAYQALSRVLQNLSVSDVTAIKEQLAADASTSEEKAT